jgi:hypothetical protein
MEVLEWRTDVMRARSEEMRHRLRERPRRQWHFNHELDADGQAAARAIVRGASSYQVVDWVLAVFAGAVPAGTSVSLAMDTSGLGLVAGQSVVVWNSALDYEVCVIESVAPAALVLALVISSRASTRVFRVDNAHAAVSVNFERPTGPKQVAQISFESTGVDLYAASSYSQYRGHDVLPMVPVAGGALQEDFSWQIERFDNETGKLSVSQQRDLIDDRFMMRWLVVTPSEIAALRAWIASRYGRWLAFWQSTWQNDIKVAADIGSSATTLRVFAPPGTTSLGRTAFDLEIDTPAGVFLRQVTNAAAGPTVSGRPTIDLTLASALGVAVSASAFRRISYLRCARFDADRIELLHRPGEGLAVSVPCIEVPVP